nr:MAG TPA: hypothetical protein [Herelleviridae sp.]
MLSAEYYVNLTRGGIWTNVRVLERIGYVALTPHNHLIYPNPASLSPTNPSKPYPHRILTFHPGTL